jgi:hypothetical protein
MTLRVTVLPVGVDTDQAEVEVGTLTVVVSGSDSVAEKPVLSSASLQTGPALLSVTTGRLSVSSLALVHGPASGNEVSFSLMRLTDAGKMSLTECNINAASPSSKFYASFFVVHVGSFS